MFLFCIDYHDEFEYKQSLYGQHFSFLCMDIFPPTSRDVVKAMIFAILLILFFYTVMCQFVYLNVTQIVCC